MLVHGQDTDLRTHIWSPGLQGAVHDVHFLLFFISFIILLSHLSITPRRPFRFLMRPLTCCLVQVTDFSIIRGQPFLVVSALASCSQPPCQICTVTSLCLDGPCR